MQNLFLFRQGRGAKLITLFVLLAIFAVSAVSAAVTLQNFEGRWNGNHVVLIFSTGSEIDHAGFHVWRSEVNLAADEVNTETATRLTTTLIRGNSCESAGFEYEFEDATVDPTEDIYYYYLESQGCTGSAPEFFGDTNNAGGLRVVNPNIFENKIYAPLIRRNAATSIPTPTPTFTPMPMPTLTPTPTFTPMPTLTPTPTIWPTSTPEPTE